MTNRQFGIGSSARAALAFAMMAGTLAASAAAPAWAQQAETPTPAPSSGRPIDFRLPPPSDNGRAPGVQGPSDNGLAPLSPGERRGSTPTPAPTPAPPRVTPTQPTTTQPTTRPATTEAPTPTRRAAPVATTAPPAQGATDTVSLAPAAAEATPGFSPAPAPAPVATVDAPLPAEDIAPAAAAPADSGGPPIWAWLLVLLAAGGAGFWYWRRRPALAGDAPVERSAPSAEPPRPAPAPAAPRAAPVPAPRAKAPATPATPALANGASAQRAPSSLVTRPVDERRAFVSLALEVTAIRVTAEHVAVAFTLNLVNQGAVDATGLMVRIALNQGSAMPEAVLARFFDGAGGSVLRDDMELKVGAGEALTTEALLPRAIVEPLMIGGKPMLVPVMAFDVTYHWDGDADAFGQVAGSFVLGRESGASGSDKLAPLPLDRASYAIDRPGARSTSVRRSQ